MVDAEVEDGALLGDARAVHDVELANLEGRGDLVLDDLDADAVADDVAPLLDGVDAADVHADGGEELERAAAGSGLGVAEHDADLLAELVDEDAGGVRLGEGAGELAKGLAHETGLEADRGVANLALNLGTRDKRGHGVDHDDVNGAGAHEHVANLERLLAGVGLGDEDLVDVDADAGGIARVERVLGVNEGDDAAHGLGLGKNLERKGGLAGRLGAVNLDDAAARNTADAKGHVERDGAGGDGLHLEVGAAVTELHDGALAELLLNLRRGGLDHVLTRLTGGRSVNLTRGAARLCHFFPFHWRPPNSTRTSVRGQQDE